MNGSPLSPLLTKGAIITVTNPLKGGKNSAFEFQFNQETMTRTLEPQGAGSNGAPSELLRLKGVPTETISFDIELDVTDEAINTTTPNRSVGLFPQLSALEMLLYPTKDSIYENALRMELGAMEILPETAPLTVFRWGKYRFLPVKITDLSITEEAFDEKLNPIRAKVSIKLRVLNYNDLSMHDPGYWSFMTHHLEKEQFAEKAIKDYSLDHPV